MQVTSAGFRSNGNCVCAEISTRAADQQSRRFVTMPPNQGQWELKSGHRHVCPASRHGNSGVRKRSEKAFERRSRVESLFGHLTGGRQKRDAFGADLENGAKVWLREREEHGAFRPRIDLNRLFRKRVRPPLGRPYRAANRHTRPDLVYT